MLQYGIFLIIALIIIFYSYKYIEPFISRKTHCASDGRCYSVVSKYSEYNLAAESLAKINNMNIALINYLKKKYKNKGTPRERILVSRLVSRYNPNVLIENLPHGTSNTSYVQNKGAKMALCLREKITGKNKIHEWHILQFVALHELTHIANKDIGHGLSFWQDFKFILREAVNAKLYNPINYQNSPSPYCGIKVTYSPLYDTNMHVPYDE